MSILKCSGCVPQEIRLCSLVPIGKRSSLPPWSSWKESLKTFGGEAAMKLA